ncbi:hypothetical protein LJC04_02400 [Ruminococcaceae bacterium OttesenSCG-928-O06]|nr:hypothetical protein [Ruminococcaceae bacterium OttesenSCG-928-O06]
MLKIGCIVWGVMDLNRGMEFWEKALDYKVLATPSENADKWGMLGPKEGDGFLFSLTRVTSPKARRHHIDLFTDDRPAEVERLIGLGATEVDWTYQPGEEDLTVLADPDGNRFCVVQVQQEGK